MTLRALVTAAAAGALAVSGLSLYVAGRRDGGEVREAEVAALTRERDAARLEAEGERASGQRLAEAQARAVQGQAVVSAFIPQALKTEDGHETLAAERARVEAIGTRHMKGVGKNLEAALNQKYENSKGHWKVSYTF